VKEVRERVRTNKKWESFKEKIWNDEGERGEKM